MTTEQLEAIVKEIRKVDTTLSVMLFMVSMIVGGVFAIAFRMTQ
jgi:hypothetical protein